METEKIVGVRLSRAELESLEALRQEFGVGDLSKTLRRCLYITSSRLSWATVQDLIVLSRLRGQSWEEVHDSVWDQLATASFGDKPLGQELAACKTQEEKDAVGSRAYAQEIKRQIELYREVRHIEETDKGFADSRRVKEPEQGIKQPESGGKRVKRSKPRNKES
jgi:hypothetical protein